MGSSPQGVRAGFGEPGLIPADGGHGRKRPIGAAAGMRTGDRHGADTPGEEAGRKAADGRLAAAAAGYSAVGSPADEVQITEQIERSGARYAQAASG
jgi:hypothetical protein